MVSTEGRSKTLLAKGFEQWPGDSIDVAGITLEHVKPMLGDTQHVKRGKADFVSVVCVLGSKEMFTAVQPAKGILFAIKCRKGKFVVTWNAEVVLMIIGEPSMMVMWVGWRWKGEGDR